MLELLMNLYQCMLQSHVPLLSYCYKTIISKLGHIYVILSAWCQSCEWVELSLLADCTPFAGNKDVKILQVLCQITQIIH